MVKSKCDFEENQNYTNNTNNIDEFQDMIMERQWERNFHKIDSTRARNNKLDLIWLVEEISLGRISRILLVLKLNLILLTSVQMRVLLAQNSSKD